MENAVGSLTAEVLKTIVKKLYPRLRSEKSIQEKIELIMSGEVIIPDEVRKEVGLPSPMEIGSRRSNHELKTLILRDRVAKQKPVRIRRMNRR